jgi:hypothetical protein
MRITRDSLLKATRETIDTRLRTERDVIAIFLMGSLQGSDPLLGGAADVDLVFIHAQEPLVPREIVRLSPEVTLDIAHHAQSLYHQPRHLRLDPWIGPAVQNARLLLHDTQHWFEFTQASVVSQFYRPENVVQRARCFTSAARKLWEDIQTGGENQAAAVLGYLKAVENAANAVASLNGVPLTERRFLLGLPERAQAAGCPQIVPGVKGLLGLDGWSTEKIQPYLPAWKSAVQEISQSPNCPIRLHPYRLPYYERAVQGLLSEGKYQEAAWPLLRSWALAMSVLPVDSPHSQAWLAGCHDIHLSPDEFMHRMEGLDVFIDSIDEILDRWARARGV